MSGSQQLGLQGEILRAVARGGKIWGCGISENVVRYVVRSCCQRAGLEHIAAHDLRRTCAKLCHSNGGELEQIQFLLGHASVLTTERYLGCKQNLGHPVNDLFDLKTNVQTQEANPGSTATKAAAVEAPLAEEVGCRLGTATMATTLGDLCHKQTARNSGKLVRRDEPCADSRFLSGLGRSCMTRGF
jgi:hypothetical protein